MAGEIHTAISSPSDKSLWNEILPMFCVRKSHLSFSYAKLLWGQNLGKKQLPEPMVNPIYCGRWI